MRKFVFFTLLAALGTAAAYVLDPLAVKRLAKTAVGQGEKYARQGGEKARQATRAGADRVQGMGKKADTFEDATPDAEDVTTGGQDVLGSAPERPQD